MVVFSLQFSACAASAPKDVPPTTRPAPASSDKLVLLQNGDVCDVVKQKESLEVAVYFAECERLDGERYEPELGVLESSNPVLTILGPLLQVAPFL